MSAGFQAATPGRTLIGRLPKGADLVEGIQALCEEHGIRAAWVEAVGAVSRLTFAHYDQAERRYQEKTSSDHHEMSGFVGNISLRDGRPFLHAHASFADREGVTRGGHLVPGSTVWVAEVRIVELEGVELIRELDEETGLALW
jgi:predicted DNA-binding protein with PD1-like motif